METLVNDDSNSNLSRVSDDASVASNTVKSHKRRSDTTAPAVSVDNVRTTSRRRIKTTRFDFDFLENEEQMYLQQVCLVTTKFVFFSFLQVLFAQALKISRKETCRQDLEIPLAPVFYPTLEEFKDTLVYINK
jgi:hypothetical protein